MKHLTYIGDGHYCDCGIDNVNSCAKEAFCHARDRISLEMESAAIATVRERERTRPTRKA